MGDKLVLEGFLFSHDEGMHPSSFSIFDRLGDTAPTFGSEARRLGHRWLDEEICGAFPRVEHPTIRYDPTFHGRVRITVERIE